MTIVKELMTPNLVMVSPESTLEEAARKMEGANCGILPVGESEDNVEGAITDRDIVVRAVAHGINPSQAKVRDYMTNEVCACNENASLEEASAMMRDNQVSRILVKDDSEKICGILTFGHVIRNHSDRQETKEVVDRATGNKMAA